MPKVLVLRITLIMFTTAKKTQQRLDEGEVDVINLERLESSMQAAINALKYEYTNTVIARITPGIYFAHTVNAVI